MLLPLSRLLRRTIPVFVVLGILVTAPPVSAGNHVGATGSTSCSSLNMMETSNSVLTYNRVFLTAPMYNAVAWALNNAVAPTDLTVSYDPTVDTSTDAVYYDWDYSTTCGFTWHPAGTVVAMAQCKYLTGAACDRHHVRFDTSASAGWSTDQARHVACHETGHVFGITHTSGSATCMASWSYKLYSTHERVDIINWIW